MTKIKFTIPDAKVTGTGEILHTREGSGGPDAPSVFDLERQRQRQRYKALNAVVARLSRSRDIERLTAETLEVSAGAAQLASDVTSFAGQLGSLAAAVQQLSDQVAHMRERHTEILALLATLTDEPPPYPEPKP